MKNNRDVILAYSIMLGLIILVGFLQSWSIALSILCFCLISAVMTIGANIQWGYAGLINFGIMGYTALGGLAILFFWRDWTPLSAISAETYRIVASPTLPTIPLFTLSGYLLAESNASERLVRLFRASFGWIPGGTPIVLVLVCGFFTALTGGSGVTILALGGLLMPILIKEGYSKDFSLGFITVAGSLGLLFPPSLPLIIYGVTAGVSIKLVFLAGIIPGLIRVGMIGGWAIWQGKVQSISKEKLVHLKLL